jgi:hypothetical protein
MYLLFDEYYSKNNYNLLIVLDKMTKLTSFDKVRDLINNKMKSSELI